MTDGAEKGGATAALDVGDDAFRAVADASGFRLEYRMPPVLHGALDAVLLCRGPLLDGTDGIPRNILPRIEGHLQGRALIAPWQVHGTAIVPGRRIWALPQRVRADGIHLDRAFDRHGSVAGSLRFGDCLPVLLASAKPRPWAMLLHSGFRGTLRNIFRAAWDKARRDYGECAFAPDDVHVWIGPGICADCYTRKRDDPTTARMFAAWPQALYRESGDLVHIALVEALCWQARCCGIPDGNIHRLSLCTRCRRDLFYSYRAGDVDDRMILVAKLRNAMPQFANDL